MDDYKQLKLALDLAREKHKGQIDKGGDDYIFHPVLVALQCDSTDAKTVALLHDVLEDTDTTEDELRSLGFHENIIDALGLLNHKDGTYEEYVRRIKESGNELAVEVKLADLTMNLDTSRLNGKKPYKYDLYVWAKEYLSDQRENEE